MQPLYGPRNYVDRTWELSANYSARTFSCYRAKPKFTTDPQCQGDCCRLCGFVFLEKKRKQNIVWEFAKMFETTRSTTLECDKRAVYDTCSYRCVHRNQPIVPTFGRHSCVARATAIYILHIVESFRSYSTIDQYSNSFPRNQNQQCRNRPQKFTIDIPSINPPIKLMEEYWFLAHNNLRVARAKQLGRSMKKTTSCKKATELPGQTSSLTGQKNIFLPNQR